MRKKVLSFIVILCTTICVSIMIYSNKMDNKENSVKDKVQVLNKKQNMEKKNIVDQEKKQSSKKEDSNKANPELNSKNTNKSSITMTDSYKKDKMDRIKENMEEDKEDFFSQSYAKDEKKSEVNNSKTDNENENKNVSNSEKDVPVFKVAKSKIKDNLTLLDKEKLLSISSKLSAVDYEKIKKYLEHGSDEDVKSTIKLLKERLSYKDYEKVKEIAEKFINMEAVNE
jgi:hypothetical protein